MFGTFFVCQQRLSTSVYSSQTKRREWRIKFHKRLIHSSLWRLRIQVTGFFFQFFFLTSRKLLFLPFVVINDGLGTWKKRTKKIEIKQNIVFISGYLWGVIGCQIFFENLKNNLKCLHELKIKEVRRHLGFVILFKPILRFWFTEIITNVAYFWMMMVAFSRYFFIPKNRNSPFFTISRHDNLNLYRKIASLVTWCLGFYMKIQTWPPPFLSGRLLLELGGKN